jgi:hypothetical protein
LLHIRFYVEENGNNKDGQPGTGVLLSWQEEYSYESIEQEQYDVAMKPSRVFQTRAGLWRVEQS